MYLQERMGKTVKAFFGILMIIAGLILGVWAGVFWAFIGGIIQIVEALKATDISAVMIAIGFAKIVCAGFIGSASALVLIVPGMAMLRIV